MSSATTFLPTLNPIAAFGRDGDTESHGRTPQATGTYANNTKLAVKPTAPRGSRRERRGRGGHLPRRRQPRGPLPAGECRGRGRGDRRLFRGRGDRRLFEETGGAAAEEEGCPWP